MAKRPKRKKFTKDDIVFRTNGKLRTWIGYNIMCYKRGLMSYAQLKRVKEGKSP